jgi:hypothetical protein
MNLYMTPNSVIPEITTSKDFYLVLKERVYIFLPCKTANLLDSADNYSYIFSYI